MNELFAIDKSNKTKLTQNQLMVIHSTKSRHDDLLRWKNIFVEP